MRTLTHTTCATARCAPLPLQNTPPHAPPPKAQRRPPRLVRCASPTQTRVPSPRPSPFPWAFSFAQHATAKISARGKKSTQRSECVRPEPPPLAPAPLSFVFALRVTSQLAPQGAPEQHRPNL
eukprot:623344-Pleurochrysis_carterae.AAC.7